tara:strand:- start:5559 stop:5897 length:339 start_codon:yes stop_codon:yes gene_type:complete
MSCAGLRGRALAECKKKAGRVKRDSIKKDRRFSNTTNPGVYSRPDNSPAGIARGRKFEKDNDYEGWKSMKRLEKKQNRANNKGRPTQRTSSQKKALTKAWNYTNLYNKKTKK